ncbi:hypothetical protein ACFLVX_05545 [Chloroflexota bacterium]
MKHQPPSKRRYELAHPLICIRLTVEQLAQLQTLKMKTGLTYAQILLRELENIELLLLDEQEKGWQAAKHRYGIVYPCSACNRLMEVDSDEEKDFCSRALAKAGWKHDSCSEGT